MGQMTSGANHVSVASELRINLVQRMLTTFRRSESLRGYLFLSPTLLLMVAMMIVPMAGLVTLSFWTQDYFALDTKFTLANYWTLIEPSDQVTSFLGLPFPLRNPIYLVLLFKSIMVSMVATISIVLLAYPMAYFLAFHTTRHKLIWLTIIIVPGWTSYLLRVFAWKVILGYNGAVNSGLIALGAIDEPLGFMLYSPTAVIITLTHSWLAFAVLPIYVSLEKIDRSLLEAAEDLGDGPFEGFLRVTLPLSMPGVIAAGLVVFIPTVGDYVTPTMVGGTTGIMIGNVIESLFGRANNWPLGSAVAITMMVAVAAVVSVFLWAIGYHRIRARASMS